MSDKGPEAAVQLSAGRSGEQVFSEDGVDLTLIRWMLLLSPTERLEVLRQHSRSIVEPRGVEYYAPAAERDGMK
jgi:hypothetical protein